MMMMMDALSSRVSTASLASTSSCHRRRTSVVIVRAGKGKRASQRRAEELASETVISNTKGGAADEKRGAPGALAGALGPISVAEFADGVDVWEYFLFARRKRAETTTEGTTAERWLPLGDIVFAANDKYSVDDVAKERFWILRDYARKRHVKLCVGKDGIEIGVRAQRGPMHPRAKNQTDIVRVCDQADAPEFHPSDDAPLGQFPAALRLLNQAEPVTAAVKAQMLRAGSQLGG